MLVKIEDGWFNPRYVVSVEAAGSKIVDGVKVKLSRMTLYGGQVVDIWLGGDEIASRLNQRSSATTEEDELHWSRR